MWVRLTWLIPGVACSLLGCGETKQAPAAAGAGGQLASAGAVGVAGSGPAPHGGNASAAGNGGAPGGSSAGDSAGQAGGAVSACVPVPHERPAPGALTGTFESLIGDFVGVYQIDAVYEHSDDCASMCLTGTTFGPKTFGHEYVVIKATSAPPRYDIEACDDLDDCKDPSAGHARIGAVDDVKSDQILFAERTYVESPQGGVCTGGGDDYWLIATAPTKIRVDVQEVRVDFPPYFSEASQLYGCASEDATKAALNQPCNVLSVVDATRVE
jgi:hypothetical protein